MQTKSSFPSRKTMRKKKYPLLQKNELTALSPEQQEAQRDAEIDAMWKYPGVSNILSF